MRRHDLLWLILLLGAVAAGTMAVRSRRAPAPPPVVVSTPGHIDLHSFTAKAVLHEAQSSLRPELDFDVGGVHLGMTCDEVMQRLGRPRDPKSDYSQYQYWEYPGGLTVDFDQERVIWVEGRVLKYRDRTLAAVAPEGGKPIDVLDEVLGTPRDIEWGRGHGSQWRRGGVQVTVFRDYPESMRVEMTWED